MPPNIRINKNFLNDENIPNKLHFLNNVRISVSAIFNDLISCISNFGYHSDINQSSKENQYMIVINSINNNRSNRGLTFPDPDSKEFQTFIKYVIIELKLLIEDVSIEYVKKQLFDINDQPSIHHCIIIDWN